MKDAQLVAQLGRRLRTVRKKGQLTLEQLAESSNVSRSMLSQIERGEANPTFATLWNLTRALGIDLAELVEDASEEECSAIELLSAAQIPKIDNAAAGCQLAILPPPAWPDKPNGMSWSWPPRASWTACLTRWALWST